MTLLKGILKNAFGEPMPNHTIVFIALKNTQTVLNTVISEIVTAENGSYEKNIYQGRYQVEIYKDGIQKTTAGIIELYSDSPDADINTYLTLPGEAEVTPEFIQQVIELKNQAIQAADEALESKTKAKEYSEAAKVSENNSAESERNANSSESSALSSKNAAADSASSAELSAQSASESASSALSDKNSAEESASSARNSEQNAKDSEINAAQSASEAAQSASSIDVSKFVQKDDSGIVPVSVLPDAVKNQILQDSLGQASGSSMIGYLQSPGARARTVQDKLQETKSVKDYGAYGDGVHDDSDAVQLAANDGAIYFTPGTYLVTKPINLRNDIDFVLKGSSGADTAIIYSGTGVMFSVSFSDSIRFVDVSDIKLSPNTLAQSTAFYFAWPEDFEHGLVRRGSFRNVIFRGVNEYEQGFNVCVHCHQGDNINFIDCEFKGAGGGTGDQSRTYNTRSGIGTQITGRYSPVEYRFIGCYFGSFDRGIDVGDTAEGIYVSNCIFICVGTAIRWETGKWSENWPGTGGQSASGRPLLSVHNTHLSYFQYGIWTSGVGSIHESDLLMYHNQNSDVVGVALCHGNSADIFITNVESVGFNPNFYTDGVVYFENVTESIINNFKAIAGAKNSYRYAIESRPDCKNNTFKQITRRANGGASFTTNILINDLSGGLNNIGMVKGGLFVNTSNQAIQSGPGTTVNFGERRYDPDTMWPGYGGEVTIPNGVSRVRVSGQVLFDSTSSSTYREIRIARNGSQGAGLPAQSGISIPGKGMYMNISGFSLDVNGGDKITLVATQDSGAALNIIGGNCWLGVEIVN